MKVKVKECKKEEWNNPPTLMKSTATGVVVLVTNVTGRSIEGIFLSDAIGVPVKKWSIDRLETFCGSITLSNDEI